jgi:hypothetical protein
METHAHSNPVRESIRFQKAVWIAERIVWALLALVPLAALAGVFSHGPLSDKTVKAPDSSFIVEYERFQRSTVQARFVFRIRAENGEAKLRLSAAFHESYDVQSLQPEPTLASANTQGIEFNFKSEDDEIIVVIWATPRRWGGIDVHAEGADASVDIPILIYP